MVNQAAHPSYDEVPYPSLSHTHSHPDHLATLATLLGLTPALVDQCRVLELGCAGGGNLIPIADGLPESTFVGIDNSAHQINEARSTAEALKLQNIIFQQLDIMDITPDFGLFDYIIAHGVFSWVPPNVQERVLEICKQNLAPQGVAYVSYNTYPGWHMLDMAREMMLFHTRNIVDPFQRVAEGRNLMQFLAESVSEKDQGAYKSFFDAYTRMRPKAMDSARRDAWLLHDELEADNNPLYFYQFAEWVAQHGLQYLTETEFSLVMPSRFPEDVVAHLNRMAKSTIEMEQYMDYLRNRTFRRTLLCHEKVTIDRTLRPERLTRLSVISRAEPVDDEAESHLPGVEKFRSSDGVSFATGHPVTQAALRYLSERSPQAIPFSELFEHACALNEIDTPDPQDAQILAGGLLQAFAYSSRLVDFHVYTRPIILEVSERPLANRVARFQAQQGDTVTNLRHERVELDPLSQAVLPRLDGQHDRAALLDIVMEQARTGVLGLKKDGEPLQDLEEARELLAQELENTLAWLGRSALLEG